MKTILWTVVVVGLMGIIAGCASNNVATIADPRVSYDESVRQIQAGEYSKAQATLQKIVLSHPGLSYIDSVQYYFAMTYYGDKEYHLSIAEFRRLMNSFPRSELTDDAQFMIATCYFESAPKNVGLDQTDTESAIREFKSFLVDFPGSDRRTDGEIMLVKAEEKLVEKKFRAGRQYFRMGNRISSRLYFEDLITQNPKSGFAAEALFMLAQLDDKEAKYADARDKLNNLINAFPNSSFVPKANKMKMEMEQKIAQVGKDSTAAAQINGVNGN